MVSPDAFLALSRLWTVVVIVLVTAVVDAFPIRRVDTLLFSRRADAGVVTHSYGHSDSSPPTAGPAITSAADLTTGNAFADGAANDKSPQCTAARAQIAGWTNVTECFGPVTQLFFATPTQVCAGKCLEVTVQASGMISKACMQSVPTEGNFGRSGVYRVWANPSGAQSACGVLAQSSDFDTFPFEVSPEEDGTLTEFKIAGVKTRLGVKVAKDEHSGPETKPYAIEAVFDLYMQWKAAKAALPDPTQAFPEATRQTMAGTQCTRFNRDFWSAFLSNPGGQPTLYYWSILEPRDYVKDLEIICGPGYLVPGAQPTATTAAAIPTPPCDENAGGAAATTSNY